MSSFFCIHCTLPFNECCCHLFPELTPISDVTILFHPNELFKRSSSGRLLCQSQKIKRAIWHRLKSDALYDIFKNHTLLYPNDSSNSQSTVYEPNSNSSTDLLILDGTWQESRKMMRQSPWLNTLPRYMITPTNASQFKLRRNQVNNGLSTLESFALWHGQQGLSEQSNKLLGFFNQFQHAFLSARQAGKLK